MDSLSDFNKTVLDEFIRIAFRENIYENAEAFLEGFDQWLFHYITERPHRGYRKRENDTWIPRWNLLDC